MHVAVCNRVNVAKTIVDIFLQWCQDGGRGGFKTAPPVCHQVHM